MKLGSQTCTKKMRVKVEPTFMPHQSAPQLSQYLFAYHITITNESRRRVQLRSRKWTIIDGNGKREDVEGPGVVGETPMIYPGRSYTYTSYCPLETHWGTMEGAFHMVDERGKSFTIQVDRFYLATPQEYLTTAH